MFDPLISLRGLQSPMGNESRPRKTKEAAKEFEAMFLYELLKEMRSASGGGLFGKGLSGEIYQTLFDMEIARRLAERGTGISEVLEKALTREEEAHPPTVPAIEEVHGKPAAHKALPVKGRISSSFGMRNDPFTGESRFHKGVDIAAPRGTPIYPRGPGEVIFSGTLSGYGNIVIIRHPDGVVTRYAHNERNLVEAGEKVDGTRPVGLVGSSGRATGPHLHYEVLVDGSPVDPLDGTGKEGV